MRIALPAVIAPPAFTSHELQNPLVRLGGATMGTSWSVVYAPPAGLTPARAQAAITARLTGLVAEMSQWEPESLISRFNRAAPGATFDLPHDFAHVITAALDIAARTDGAFDPAIGGLSALWGYGPRPAAVPPSADQITAALAASSWHRLGWNGAHLTQPGGAMLDLSGIAKGHAVDAVADTLASFGARNALVEIGGELVGRGMRPDGEPWWVDLENPPGVTLPPFRVALHGLAVATSGNYRRGEHSLDPRTGQPTRGILSVSVVAPTALEADAWATALTVLGPDVDARIAARFIVADDGGIREHLTLALAAMM